VRALLVQRPVLDAQKVALLVAASTLETPARRLEVPARPFEAATRALLAHAPSTLLAYEDALDAKAALPAAGPTAFEAYLAVAYAEEAVFEPHWAVLLE
jgi:hypothetical protein